MGLVLHCGELEAKEDIPRASFLGEPLKQLEVASLRRSLAGVPAPLARRVLAPQPAHDVEMSALYREGEMEGERERERERKKLWVSESGSQWGDGYRA